MKKNYEHIFQNLIKTFIQVSKRLYKCYSTVSPLKQVSGITLWVPHLPQPSLLEDFPGPRRSTDLEPGSFHLVMSMLYIPRIPSSGTKQPLRHEHYPLNQRDTVKECRKYVQRFAMASGHNSFQQVGMYQAWEPKGKHLSQGQILPTAFQLRALRMWRAQNSNLTFKVT